MSTGSRRRTESTGSQRSYSEAHKQLLLTKLKAEFPETTAEFISDFIEMYVVGMLCYVLLIVYVFVYLHCLCIGLGASVLAQVYIASAKYANLRLDGGDTWVN